MHAAKKRRLNGSPAFQNKPYRSPLPKHLKAQPHAEQIQTVEAERHLTPSIWPPGCTSDPLGQKLLSSPSVESPSSNHEHEDYQKERSALSSQLTKLRQSLETAQQALEIAQSNQDAELRKLIVKWRTVSQEAAEELFADAKEKIDAIGGMAAWRRRMKEDARGWTGNEDARTLHHDDDDDGEELEPFHQKPTEEDEDSYTMDTMLRQMNIDLRVIGYDQQSERWAD